MINFLKVLNFKGTNDWQVMEHEKLFSKVSMREIKDDMLML